MLLHSCSSEKKLILFVGPMFHCQAYRATFTTDSKTTVLKGEEPHGNDIGENVRILCKEGLLNEALRSLDVMNQRGIEVQVSTYASLFHACVNSKALPEGKLVHAHIIQMGFQFQDIFLTNTLLTMYAKCGSLANARRVLDGMHEPNVVSWTVMIAAYARHGQAEEALTLYYHMHRAGVQPNKFTLASVLPACANLAALEHGKKIHEEIIIRGFQSNVFVGSGLVDMYVKCGRINNARQVFDKMSERDVVSWNAMIAGYAMNGHVDEALNLFQKMPQRNVVSWNALIAGFAQSGHFEESLKLFEKMPERDVVSWTAMIAGYAQNGHVDEAMKLFQKMRKRNVVSWNAMIAGFAQNGHFDEALKLYRKMQVEHVKPDLDTFANVLQACANLAALEHGKEVHKDIIRTKFQSDVFVGTALVDMYAKCGSIRNACEVFDAMSKRDVVSWNAMILGYAMHGCGKEALQLFEQMQNSTTKPNHVTFVGVLSACCHAGLVDDGWQYFGRMSQYYQITPVVEHYCCMVDLLGRAGHLDEALEFIHNMPVKPDAAVWGSLLGACRTYNNIELGERVAEYLFELDPTNSATYVLLSNMYAAACRWDDIEKVRKMMKNRRVKKKPGRSWIEVNNKVHTFVVGDKSHPQMKKIYGELGRLSGQMKDAGYVPETKFELHDVEDEQKEHSLCHHSEKLAIAFGFINTSPGTPIRIVKNLRVCGDCHSATKFISKMVAREIVIRDANRFHHFVDGQCSCGDYW